MASWPTAARCSTSQWSAAVPTWMTFGGVLVVLLSVQLQLSSAVLKESCTLNGSSGVCRPYATCRDQLQNKEIHVCGHSAEGAIVCCPPVLENRMEAESERIAVRKCNGYRKLSYDQVSGIGLSFMSIVSRYKVPKCDSITKLIVGGNLTKPGEFPHMAAIGWREADKTESFHCGGSLISDRFVLTAAHCYEAINGALPSFVRLGDQHLFRDDDRAQPKNYNIAEFKMHPQFRRRGGSRYNDIALIKLDRAVTFSSYIRPACLYDREATPSKEAIATGFGALDSTEESSNELMKVSLKIYDNKVCAKAFDGHRAVKEGVRATQLCAGNVEGGYDTCQGDSGGPLQITDQGNHCVFYVFGITSIGQSCGGNVPAIYTRVASFLSWIEPIVWNENE